MFVRSTEMGLNKMNTRSVGFPSLAVLIACLACQTGCAINPGRTGNVQSARTDSIDIKADLAKTRQLYESGEKNSAHHVVSQAIRRDPYSVEARRLQAQISYGMGMRVESARALQAIRALEPSSADVQHEIGLSLIQLEAHQAGLQALQRATELAPHRPEFSRDLASAHLSVGNEQAAKAVLIQAHRNNLSDQNLPVALARMYEGQKNWGRAAHYFGLAATAEPENQAWVKQRGLAWYRSGDYEAAYNDLASCLDDMVAEEDWATLLDYGDSCLKTKRHDAARNVAALLQERSPEDASGIAQFIASVPVQSSPEEAAPLQNAPKNVPAQIVEAKPTAEPATVLQVAKTTTEQPRVMRNLTLVRHDHSAVLMRHASYVYEQAAAEASELAKSIDEDPKARRSTSADEGWTAHRREG